MNNRQIFSFKTNLSCIEIPEKINNPFELEIPEVVKIAAREFQDFIVTESSQWEHDFNTQKGKMFGILVIQKEDHSYGYLGTVSGKLLGNSTCEKFVSSVFDTSTDDFFINKGMTELTALGKEIKTSSDPNEIIALKEKRKQQSVALQHRLFENYNFLNLHRKEKNLIAIFDSAFQSYPPSAAGECAAPKLLNHAFANKLKPIGIGEFWWGSETKNQVKKHRKFYPACKDRCRAILEYMLDDKGLFDQVSLEKHS